MSGVSISGRITEIPGGPLQGNVISIKFVGGLIGGVGGGSKEFICDPLGGKSGRGLRQSSSGDAMNDPLRIHQEAEPRYFGGKQRRPR